VFQRRKAIAVRIAALPVAAQVHARGLQVDDGVYQAAIIFAFHAIPARGAADLGFQPGAVLQYDSRVCRGERRGPASG